MTQYYWTDEKQSALKFMEDGEWTNITHSDPEFYEIVNSDANILSEAKEEWEIESNNRLLRAHLLEQTDQFALADRVLTDEMREYREALRNITTHTNWPNLSDNDWPVYPD